ncbi:MAG: hypothetical protein GXO73_12045, partial [Calditrichaeota bacterium]|nr:hypothetical protein [Calditrichota bacterium]
TLKLSVQSQALPERVVRWLHVAVNDEDVDVAATRSHVLLRLAGKQWKPIFEVDSSVAAIEASPLAQFVGVLQYTRRPKPGSPGELTLQVRDRSGAIVNKWHFQWDYDRPVPALVLGRRASTAAVGWADVGLVQIFSASRAEPVTVDLYPDDEYGYERSLYLAYDDSTDRYVALASRHGVNPTAQDPDKRSVGARLFWIDPTGRVLKSLAIEAEGISAFRFDRRSRLVVVGCTDFPAPDRPLPFAEIRTANGRLLARVEHVTPESFAVTSDRRLSVLADPSRAVAVDLVQKLELWRQTRDGDEPSILGATVVEKPACVALLTATVVFKKNAFVYVRPKVSLVDVRGKEIGVTAFPDTFFTKARLAPDPRGGLRVLTHDRVWTVSLAQ